MLHELHSKKKKRKKKDALKTEDDKILQYAMQ
jgi:hypothetical protein